MSLPNIKKQLSVRDWILVLVFSCASAAASLSLYPGSSSAQSVRADHDTVRIALAGGTSYSSDCLDWPTRGWTSQVECLHDGRWHHVMSHSAAGGISFGSKAALTSHIAKGATIKVTGGSVSMIGATNTICTTAYQSSVSGAIYCLVEMRFAGEAPPYITASTSRIGSDGSLYCLSENQTNMNACATTASGKWFVRY